MATLSTALSSLLPDWGRLGWGEEGQKLGGRGTLLLDLPALLMIYKTKKLTALAFSPSINQSF